jgi:DNA polymerase-3 subunit chi
MTKVDFYILDAGSREHTACKLVEKAYSLGHKIYVHTASEEQARHMDELLWTFHDRSFLPHEPYRHGQETAAPIQVGAVDAPDTDGEVLINLAHDVPLFFSRFLRVAEVIGTDETEKHQGRERFRFYRDRGYPLDTHKLG